MIDRKLLVGLGLGTALAIAIASCGGESAEPTPPTPPAAPAPSTASGAGARGAAAGPMTGPEFDGDHSLPGDPVAGQIVYQASCVACHAANGRGNGGLTGADFVGDRRRLAQNNDTLLRSIREGVPTASPAMPAHRDILSDTQMRDALSYVRATFGGDAPATR